MAHSADGLEQRLIAKDILYKFEAWLKARRGRGFSLKLRLAPYRVKHHYVGTKGGKRNARCRRLERNQPRKASLPIPYSLKKQFAEFRRIYDV